MKFALPIKFVQTGCLATVVGFGIEWTEAQPTASIFPAIGTGDKVNITAAKSVNRIFLFGTAYKTNGSPISIGGNNVSVPTSNPFTNKAAMDQLTATQMVSKALLFVATNTNPVLDKSMGVLIQVDCFMDANGQTSQDIFYYENNIHLVKNPNGSYSVPDLSEFSTVLNDSIPFYIPNLQWARLEIGSDGNSNPFEVDDIRLNSATNPISSDGFLYLATDVITNSATSGGTFWLKLTVFDGVFQIFNGDGNQISETPMALAMNQHGTNVTVTVNGGDSGRGFVLQSSASLTAWTNLSPVTFISPTNDLSGAQPSQFVYPTTNRSLFFRTATTNSPPT